MHFSQKTEFNQGSDTLSKRPTNQKNNSNQRNYPHNSSYFDPLKNASSTGNTKNAAFQNVDYIPLRYPAYRIADMAHTTLGQDGPRYNGEATQQHSSYNLPRDENFRGSIVPANNLKLQHDKLARYIEVRKPASKESSKLPQLSGNKEFISSGSKRNASKTSRGTIYTPETGMILSRRRVNDTLQLDEKQLRDLEDGHKLSKNPSRNPLKLSSIPSVLKITEEDKFNLHMAILALYKDRIEPDMKEIRLKLNESKNMIDLNQCVLFYLSHDNFYEVKINGGKIENIYLRSPPPWFKGWINIKDPSNCYPQALWEHFLTFLAEKIPSFSLHDGLDARYRLAKDFKKYSNNISKSYSLGELYHFIELSFLNGMLTYEEDFIVPSFASKWLPFSIINPIISKSTSELPEGVKLVTDLHELRQMLIYLISDSNHGFIYLLKLKSKLYKKYRYIINPSYFNCSTLEELIESISEGYFILEFYHNQTIVRLNPALLLKSQDNLSDLTDYLSPKIKSAISPDISKKTSETHLSIVENLKRINTPHIFKNLEYWNYTRYNPAPKEINSSHGLNLPLLHLHYGLIPNSEAKDDKVLFPLQDESYTSLLDQSESPDLYSNMIDLIRLPRSFTSPLILSSQGTEEISTQQEGSHDTKDSNRKVFQFLYLKKDSHLPDVIKLVSQFTHTHLSSDFRRLLKYYTSFADLTTDVCPVSILDSNIVDNSNFDFGKESNLISISQNKYRIPTDNFLSINEHDIQTMNYSFDKFQTIIQREDSYDDYILDSLLNESNQLNHNYSPTLDENDVLTYLALNHNQAGTNSQIFC